MKIYDCFTFFNERELLELRIRLLENIVDHFVIIEADRTHTGNPKSFICKQIIKDLSLPKNKITVVELRLPSKEEEPDDHQRENLQRDVISDYIDYDTIAIITDCDEIIDPDFVKYYTQILKNHPNNILRIPMAYLMCRADLRVYDQAEKIRNWSNGYLCMKHHLDRYKATEIRESHSLKKNNLIYKDIYAVDNGEIKEAGWHLGWMGDSERLKIKYRSFMHYEDHIEGAVEREKMDSFLDRYSAGENSTDPLGRKDYLLKSYDINKLPKFIFDSKKLKDFFLPNRKTDLSSLISIVKENPNFITDKNSVHSYIENFYEDEFYKYREKEIDFLEIGIQTGGSIALWNLYFLRARILGIDPYTDKLLDKFKAENFSNVRYIFEDAYCKKLVDSLPNFDIIIDDGPHTLDSQIKCIELYLPKLNNGGILIIEDLQDPSWFDSLISALPAKYKNSYQCLDFRSNKGRYDDLLFVVRT
jgi:hypothetical protein